MNITIVQNSSYGSAGLVDDYIRARGWTGRQILSAEDLIWTDLDRIEADRVVFLGSPRGVYETHVQWISRQHALMRRMIDKDIPVFGICFGAQLLAAVSGGHVGPMGRSFRGWIANEESTDPISHGPWLRWHGDAITLPQHASPLAADQGTVQAFRMGRHVGVQFHPEVSGNLLRGWLQERDPSDHEARAALERAAAFADGHAAEIRRRAFDLFDFAFAA